MGDAINFDLLVGQRLEDLILVQDCFAECPFGRGTIGCELRDEARSARRLRRKLRLKPFLFGDGCVTLTLQAGAHLRPLALSGSDPVFHLSPLLCNLVEELVPLGDELLSGALVTLRFKSPKILFQLSTLDLSCLRLADEPRDVGFEPGDELLLLPNLALGHGYAFTFRSERLITLLPLGSIRSLKAAEVGLSLFQRGLEILARGLLRVER